MIDSIILKKIKYSRLSLRFHFEIASTIHSKLEGVNLIRLVPIDWVQLYKFIVLNFDFEGLEKSNSFFCSIIHLLSSNFSTWYDALTICWKEEADKINLPKVTLFVVCMINLRSEFK